MESVGLGLPACGLGEVALGLGEQRVPLCTHLAEHVIRSQLGLALRAASAVAVAVRAHRLLSWRRSSVLSSLAKRGIMSPRACSALHDDSGRILVVRREQFSIEARKFPAKTLTGNDPTAHFGTFAPEQPQIAIFFDEHPPIMRRHRPGSSASGRLPHDEADSADRASEGFAIGASPATPAERRSPAN
jgi:hypothetical protein